MTVDCDETDVYFHIKAARFQLLRASGSGVQLRFQSQGPPRECILTFFIFAIITIVPINSNCYYVLLHYLFVGTPLGALLCIRFWVLRHEKCLAATVGAYFGHCSMMFGG